ncbi:MAG TPA: sigma-70 family RNA polymerase sigma factor [Vicinamibacteria bacterium]|nr:sigma-70 family RNA polymerase sigma factor [Vicinamibacteria bacterium]
MEVADAALVERTLAGDIEGFGELHRRYYRRVVRVVLTIMKDRIQAEDMVQDAYASALRELPRLKDPARFFPWICRIAVNRAIEDRRRAGRRARLDARVVASDVAVAEAEDRLLRAERAEKVRLALEKLPEGQRAAVVLRYFDELPMRQIGEALGCGEVTARSQVFRGLRKLGVFLKAKGATR